MDTAKKLRLISSAAGLFSPTESLANLFHGFGTTLLGSGSTAVVSFMHATGGDRSAHEIPAISSIPRRRTADSHGRRFSKDRFFRKVSASSADHYRALPLSDGYHILFTDPRTGNLCLGTDAPVGSLTRLLRKVWFRPPACASSPLPVLYTAGADTRHGVRVAATFSVNDSMRTGTVTEVRDMVEGMPGSENGGKQIVVFYTVPPDMFHDISQTEVEARMPSYSDSQRHDGHEPVPWRPEERYHAIDVFSDPFQSTTVYPLEIRGQSVAICSDIVELCLDSSPEMIIWAFSAEGWGRAWAIGGGAGVVPAMTEVQRDGSLRFVDVEGDVGMVDAEDFIPREADVAALIPPDWTPTPSS